MSAIHIPLIGSVPCPGQPKLAYKGEKLLAESLLLILCRQAVHTEQALLVIARIILIQGMLISPPPQAS